MIREIASRGLPFRVFNDYAVVKGPRRGLCCGIAIVDQSNKVKLAAEFKYEPDHRRQDILRQKLPVVGWVDMQKDITRIRTFVDAGAIESGYTIFIDEGGFFRHRDAHTGSDWVDWPQSGDRGAPRILFSRWTTPTPVTARSEPATNDRTSSAEDDAEFEAKLREAEKTRRNLEQRGWLWHNEGEEDIEKLLCHSDDPEIKLWFNPHSGDVPLSPRLMQRLNALIRFCFDLRCPCHCLLTQDRFLMTITRDRVSIAAMQVTRLQGRGMKGGHTLALANLRFHISLRIACAVEFDGISHPLYRKSLAHTHRRFQVCRWDVSGIRHNLHECWAVG